MSISHAISAFMSNRPAGGVGWLVRWAHAHLDTCAGGGCAGLQDFAQGATRVHKNYNIRCNHLQPFGTIIINIIITIMIIIIIVMQCRRHHAHHHHHNHHHHHVHLHASTSSSYRHPFSHCHRHHRRHRHPSCMCEFMPIRLDASLTNFNNRKSNAETQILQYHSRVNNLFMWISIIAVWILA